MGPVAIIVVILLAILLWLGIRSFIRSGMRRDDDTP